MQKEPRRNRREDPGSLAGPAAAAAVLALTLLGTAACAPSPEEVVEAERAEQTLAEGESGDAEVQVGSAGPAAWTCERFLVIADDTDPGYDAEATAAAVEFVADYLRAGQQDTAERWTDLPVRASLRGVCEESGASTLLADAAETLRERMAQPDESRGDAADGGA